MCEERRDAVSERGRRSLGCRMAEVGSEGGGGLCARIVILEWVGFDHAPRRGPVSLLLMWEGA